MMDLSFLTEEEQEILRAVIVKDAALKETEYNRIRQLEAKLHDEKQYKLVTGIWFEEVKEMRYQDGLNGTDLVRSSLWNSGIQDYSSETSSSTESVYLVPYLGPRDDKVTEASQDFSYRFAEDMREYQENLNAPKSILKPQRQPPSIPFSSPSLIAEASKEMTSYVGTEQSFSNTAVLRTPIQTYKEYTNPSVNPTHYSNTVRPEQTANYEVLDYSVLREFGSCSSSETFEKSYTPTDEEHSPADLSILPGRAEEANTNEQVHLLKWLNTEDPVSLPRLQRSISLQPFRNTACRNLREDMIRKLYFLRASESPLHHGFNFSPGPSPRVLPPTPAPRSIPHAKTENPVPVPDDHDHLNETVVEHLNEEEPPTIKYGTHARAPYLAQTSILEQKEEEDYSAETQDFLNSITEAFRENESLNRDPMTPWKTCSKQAMLKSSKDETDSETQRTEKADTSEESSEDDSAGQKNEFDSQKSASQVMEALARAQATKVKFCFPEKIYYSPVLSYNDSRQKDATDQNTLRFPKPDSVAHDNRTGSSSSVGSTNFEDQACIQFHLDYSPKTQEFQIYIAQCRNLDKVKVQRGDIDPYIKTYLLPDNSRTTKRKTTVKKQTANPMFNEILRYKIEKNSLVSHILSLSVWDYNMLGKNRCLGELAVALNTWNWNDRAQMWYPLKSCVRHRTESTTC
ncbi:SYTL2 protein, partial [Atractosteus spatula]|nr:SYTL2 protein [Atractosteus spatula]